MMALSRCLPTLVGAWSLVVMAACGADKDDSPGGGSGGQVDAGGDGGAQSAAAAGASGDDQSGQAAAGGTGGSAAAAPVAGAAGQSGEPSAGGDPGMIGMGGAVEVEFAPYTVFGGEVTTTADGCLTNTAEEQTVSTWLLMDEALTDRAVDFEIAGALLPVGQFDPASVWVHLFATIEGRQVATSVALDLRHNVAGLYRYQQSDSGADWITVGEEGEHPLNADPTRSYRLRAEGSVDLLGTSSVQATIGAETVTLTGDNLGTPEGTQLLLRFQNATICRFVF